MRPILRLEYGPGGRPAVCLQDILDDLEAMEDEMPTPKREKPKGRKPRKKGAAPYGSDLEFLQDELLWVEQRCIRIVKEKRFEQRCMPRGDAIEDWEPPRMGLRRRKERPLGNIRRDLRKATRRETELRAEVDARLAASTEFVPALEQLCRRFELDWSERCTLLMAIGPAFSRRFKEVYDQLTFSACSEGCMVDILFNFLELSLAQRISRRAMFSRTGRLLANDLITLDFDQRTTGPEELLSGVFKVTPRTFDFLTGRPGLSDDLLEFSSFIVPQVDLDQVVLDPADKRRILSVVERHERYLACRREWKLDDRIHYGRGMLMLFYGKPGTGKTMTAHAIARHLGKRILNVDIPALVERGASDHLLPGLFRDARLHDAVLFFDECEAIFASRTFGNSLMTTLLTEIERFEGVAILATNMPRILDEALDRRILVKVQFPEPDRQARLEIWRKHLPPSVPLAEDVDLEVLADRYDLAGGYIKNAVLMAAADAVHSNGDQPKVSMAALERAARDQMRRPIEEEDEIDVVYPKTLLADVVLDPALQARVVEIIAAARNRRTVLERWGIGAHFSYGKGLSALFTGLPGTGKTLCAQAVAGELGRPLLVAPIPALVSKFVGDTEKNIEGMFRHAARLGGVLFLDEADSLLMARGEGLASRHDDSAVNVLLKLIERHDGVVLLATNRGDRLDGALTRRLSYSLRFPLPEAPARAEIWRKLLPTGVPVAADLDLDRLARAFPLSGGHIKNAVFKAAFRAANANTPVSQSLLHAAAAEELAAMEGTEQKKTIGFGARN